MVQLFDIGSEKTQVGIISFSTTVVPELSLGELRSKNEIIDKIMSIEFLGGNTNTGEALSYLREKAFKEAPSSSPNERPKIAIILTDGQSNDVQQTISEATKAKLEGITLFVIGIGSQVDTMELEAIASKPTKTYMFSIGNFDALDSIKDTLAIRACAVQPSTPAPPMLHDMMMNDDDILYGDGKCQPANPLSIAYAVDTSSMGAENAYFVMVLVNRIASRLEMNKDQISFSVVTSKCGNSKGDAIVDHAHDTEALQKGLGAIGTSSFETLIKDMRQKIQSDKDRKVGFVFLSRQLTKEEFHKSELESRRAKFKKIEIFVVGIGSRLDESQAVGLTMEKDHYLHADSYNELYELEGPILYRICHLK